MESARPLRRGFLFPALAILAAFAAQSLLSSRVKSPVFDEPAHIAAGLAYLETGNFTLNRQHPPLLKELSGAALLLGGVHGPSAPEVRKLAASDLGSEFPIGTSILMTNDPHRTLFRARLPFVILATFLGVLIFFWGREIAGETAALGALFLYAFDPTILAHSYLVTTDMGVATFGMLFLIALWRFARGPSWKTLLLAGVALGLALTAKFSAVFWVPAALCLVLASVRWRSPNTPEFGPMFATVLGGESKPANRDKDRIREYGLGVLAVLVIGLTAVVVIQLVYFSPSGLASYVDGARAVNGDHDPNYLVFMAGRLQHRFPSYFLAAYVLKEPIATLVLVLIGFFAVIRSKRFGTPAKLFLLVPGVVLAGSCSLFADDLGIRYLIPALPFAYLLGGAGVAWLLSKSTVWARGIAIGLCLWLLIVAIGIYPDHLAYFNEAACIANPAAIGWDGGTRCGPAWLDDSNVDWGQGLKQLSAWVMENGRGRPLRFAYFGSFPPDGYGLPAEKDAVRKLATDATPGAGLYAVSAHWVARIPALAARDSAGAAHWLVHARPIAIVGHSIYIYDNGQ
jgi:hypothetical protein